MAHWSTAVELATAVENTTYVPTTLDSCEKELAADKGHQSVRFSQFTLFKRRQDRHRDSYLALQPQRFYRSRPERQIPNDMEGAPNKETSEATEAPRRDVAGQAAALASPSELSTDSSEQDDPAGALDAFVSAAEAIVNDDLDRGGQQQTQRHHISKFVDQWSARFPLTAEPPKDLASVKALRRAVATARWPSSADATAVRRIERELDQTESDQDFLNRYTILRPQIVSLLVRGALDSMSAAIGSRLNVTVRAGARLRFEDLTDAILNLTSPSAFQSVHGPHALIALCTTYEQVWSPVGYTRGELVGSLSLAPGERLTLEVHSWDKSTTHSEAELALESEMRSTEKHTQRDALTVLQEYASKHSTRLEAGGTIPIGDLPLELGFQEDNEAQSRLTRTTERIRDGVVESSSVLKVNRKLKIESSREVGREDKQTRVVENTNRCHTLNCHYFEIISNYLVTTRPVGVEPGVLIKYPRIKFTADVVLCHEGTLRASLLDRTFLPGFQAAHELKVAEEEEGVESRRRTERLDLAGAQLDPYAQVIADAYETLRNSVNAMDEAIALRGYGNEWEVWADLSPLQIDQVWAWLGLPVLSRTALDRFVQDLAGGSNAAESIRSLAALLPPAIPPRAYYQTFLELNNRLGSFEPADGEGEITGPAPWRLMKDLIECDDAGLRAAFLAAAQALRVLPTPDFSELTSSSARDIALATVDFDRLVCHLEGNWMHYNHAIWAQESFDQRFERFSLYGWAASLIENRIIGFHGQFVAFPLHDHSVVDVTDLDSILAKMRETIGAFAAKPVLISIPSAGQVLEATVGECNACEDYIRKSRAIDLRLQSAAAKRAEVEATRWDSRVQGGDLSDPEVRPHSLSIDLTSHVAEPDE